MSCAGEPALVIGSGRLQRLSQSQQTQFFNDVRHSLIWLVTCTLRGMNGQHTSECGARLKVPRRRYFRLERLSALLIATGAGCTGLAAAPPEAAAGLAFARHVAAAEARDPFNATGFAMLRIDAAIPGLYKQSSLLGIQKTAASGEKEYLWLSVDGDPFVGLEVIAPYLALREQYERLPQSSVAITPANYKFHYVGPIGGGAMSAHVFRIKPRRKADGLIAGELWIDAASGASVLLAGTLARTPRQFAAPIQVVRDITLMDGVPVMRITHLTLATKPAGRAELIITEIRMFAESGLPLPLQLEPDGAPGRNRKVPDGALTSRYRPESR